MGNKLCDAKYDVDTTVCRPVLPQFSCEQVMCTDDNNLGGNCTKFCCQGMKVPEEEIATCYYDGSWSAQLECVG